jgi:hypothetical protein
MMSAVFCLALTVAGPVVYGPVTSAVESFVVGTEVPVEDQSLTLGVASDPFPVAAELRVVRGEELEPGQGPLAELVDDRPVAEDALDLPVGGQGTEIDNPHVTLRRLRLLQFFR